MAAHVQAGRTKDPDRWLATLHSGKLPSKADIIDLCARARDLFSKEANVAKVSSPVTVVGDLHGQFYDLKELLEVGGECPTANYLFLGDYVDRGYYSLETLLLLLGLKVRWPSRVTMLRGNHETRQITQVYGFYDECMRKFGSSEIWSVCCEVFDTMPLAALVVDYGAFGVHAGLSPSLDTIDQIEQLERHKEVPHEGPMCDLLWSDPEDMAGWGVSQRGAGYVFGEDIVEQFNHTNDLAIVCRSHQLVMEGYKEFANGGLVTVWSAPNYCYRCGNDAAVLTFECHPTSRKQYSTFKAAPEDVRRKPPECGGKEVRSLPDYFL